MCGTVKLGIDSSHYPILAYFTAPLPTLRQFCEDLKMICSLTTFLVSFSNNRWCPTVEDETIKSQSLSSN